MDCMQGLGRSRVLCEHLEALKFTAPTRIQQATLPVLLVRAILACVQAHVHSHRLPFAYANMASYIIGCILDFITT